MNPSSPFAAAIAGEQFTIRELTMLLPPQFVRTESMPGDQPVTLPMDLLRHSMEQGRPALRLSQIYQACPFLFNRQVQPLEDVEVVLPWQKVKRMLDGAGNAPVSPFVAVAPPGGRMESPFAAAASPFVPAGGPAASPFAARTPEPAPRNEVLTPFASETLPPVDAAPSAPAGNPFQQRTEPPPPPPRAASPFQLISPAAEPPPASLPVTSHIPSPSPSPFGVPGNGNGKGHTAPVPLAVTMVLPATRQFEAPHPATAAHPPAPAPTTQPIPAPAPSSEAPAPASTTQRIKVMLSALLRDVTADDLGFDPVAVPDHVEAELPLETILPQLSTGRVEVGIEELRQGVVDRFRPAFARVRSDLRFVVPLSEIFRSLPETAIPAPQAPPPEHIPIATSPFQTPFALKAEEDAARDGQPALPPLVAQAQPVPATTTLPSFPVPPALDTPKSQSAPITLPSSPVPPASHEPAPPSAAPAMTSPPTSAPGPTPAPIKLPGMPKLPNIPGMAGRPSPFSRPPGTAPGSEAPAPSAPFAAPPATLPAAPGAENHDDLGQPFPAGSLRAEPPVAPAPAPAQQAPFNPASLFSDSPQNQQQSPSPLPFRPAPAIRPAAAPAPAAARTPAAAASPIEFNFGETPDMARVMMRAIFDTDQDLTAHEIVDHIAQLPGLRSAIAILEGGIIASGHESGAEDVAQFLHSAPKSCEYLGGLAESMGYGSSGSFTMRAGTGVRTFFIENGRCLAVLHTDPVFAPGVRDKLLVTIRTIGEPIA